MEKIKNFFDNAILLFGMRRRSRSAGMLVMLLICVLVSSSIIISVLGLMTFFGSDYDSVTEAATVFFAILAIGNASLVFFVTGITASSEITSEKTRQTMDLLVCSQMTPAQIVWGKLLSSFSYTTLITVAMLPVYSLIFIFGGISATLIVSTFLMIFFFSFVIAAIAIGFSASVRKTIAALVLTMVVIFALTAGNGILYSITEAFEEFCKDYLNFSTFLSDYDVAPPVIWLNPIYFIVLICWGSLEGFGNLWNEFPNYPQEFIITLIATPLICAALSWLSIRLAIRKINPLKSDKLK